MFKIINSRRGNNRPCLIYNNYKYYKFRDVSPKFITWRCTLKTCCVTLRTDGDVKELVEDLSGVHNHPQIDDAMIEKQQVRNNIKRIAVDNIDLLPGKIIQKEAATTWCIESKDVDRFRKVIYYQRKKLKNKLTKKSIAQNDTVVLSKPDARKFFSQAKIGNNDSRRAVGFHEYEGNQRTTHFIKQLAVEMDSKRPPGERVFSKNGPSSMWLKRFLRRNEINFPAGRAGGRNKVVKVRIQHDESTTSTYTSSQENVYPEQFSDDPVLSNCVANFENVTGCNSSDDVKYSPTFPIDEEKSMVEKLLQLIDESGIEMSSEEIRRFAFYYAWFYNLPNDFDKKTKLAGEEWYLQLTERYPEIIPVSERSIELEGASSSTNQKNSESISFNSSSSPARKKKKSDNEFPLVDQLTEDQDSSECLNGNDEDVKPIVKAEPLDFDLEFVDEQDIMDDQYSDSLLEPEPENTNCSDLSQNVTCVITEENTRIALPTNEKLTEPPRLGARDKDENLEKSSSKHCTCDSELRGLTQSTFHSVIDLSHPIDSFFHSIAQMVKKLNPINQIKAKKATSNIVMEFELEEACEAINT